MSRGIGAASRVSAFYGALGGSTEALIEEAREYRDEVAEVTPTQGEESPT